MEERGIISGYQGSKPREVLMTLDRLKELKMGTKETEHNNKIIKKKLWKGEKFAKEK